NLGSRQRVQRLIAMAKAAEEAALALQNASREFHERLAAVEATLDEVVSGITPAIAEPDEAEYVAVDSIGQPEAVRVAPFAHPFARPAFHADSMSEPTRAMPALQALMHPTKELPPPDENAPWWRRRNGPGAA